MKRNQLTYDRERVFASTLILGSLLPFTWIDQNLGRLVGPALLLLTLLLTPRRAPTTTILVFTSGLLFVCFVSITPFVDNLNIIEQLLVLLVIMIICIFELQYYTIDKFYRDVFFLLLHFYYSCLLWLFF